MNNTILDMQDIDIIILCLMYFKNADAEEIPFGCFGVLQEIPAIIEKLQILSREV